MDGKVLGHRVDKQQGPSKFIGQDFTDREYFQKSKNGQTCVVGIKSASTGLIATVIATRVEKIVEFIERELH